MLIRRERDDDVPAVRAIVAAAFVRDDGGEPIEVPLLDALRRDAGWIPAFSLVAEVDGTPAGHVVATRGQVDAVAALGLGPIAVRPEVQGRGVGSALVHGIVGAARARDEPLIALLGDQGWYRRFGFRPARELGVRAPDLAWGDHFQALALGPTSPTGTFRYAAPFADL